MRDRDAHAKQDRTRPLIRAPLVIRALRPTRGARLKVNSTSWRNCSVTNNNRHPHSLRVSANFKDPFRSSSSSTEHRLGLHLKLIALMSLKLSRSDIISLEHDIVSLPYISGNLENKAWAKEAISVDFFFFIHFISLCDLTRSLILFQGGYELKQSPFTKPVVCQAIHVHMLINQPQCFWKVAIYNWN